MQKICGLLRRKGVTELAPAGRDLCSFVMLQTILETFLLEECGLSPTPFLGAGFIGRDLSMLDDEWCQ